jgi:hypothetical protein
MPPHAVTDEQVAKSIDFVDAVFALEVLPHAASSAAVAPMSAMPTFSDFKVTSFPSEDLLTFA